MVANRPFSAALRRLASCALLATTLAFGPAALAQVSNTATIAPPAGITDPSGGCTTANPPVCSGNNTATDTDGLVRINAAKAPGTVSGPNGSGVYTVTYTVTVTNTGNAAGIYGPLADSPVFPSHTSITGATWTTSGTGAPAGGSSAAAGPYQLAPASTAIAAGATHTFNLSITYRYVDSAPSNTCAATPTPGSGLYNGVALGAGQETNTADNAACVVPPAPPALSITKSASAAGFTVGVPASYTLAVQNIGGLPTDSVATITDAIPAGLTIGTLPAGCSAAGQTVTCTIPAGLAVNASASFVIPVTPSAAAAGTTANNTAAVSGGGDFTCPGVARCSSSVSTPVAGAPQLTMAKTASAAAFTVGVPASYTLQLSNTGSAATTAVATITDAIPAGLTLGTLPAGCSASGQTVTCTVAAGLAAGASTSFVIPVTPTAAAQPSVTNTATASGGGDAACPADARCASSVTTPVNAPQLTLLKTASASPWTVGVPASYTLQLSNTGTAATTAVATITDAIPAGLTIGTLPAGCSASGQTVTCTVAAGLAAGASTSFVIPVTPTAAAQPSVTNTATASGGGDATCPAAARCTSAAGPTPVNAPQLTMTKTASAASFTVGVPASYTLAVQNTGTAATTATATITDTIPAGLAIGTLPAGCSASGQTVTCTIAAGLAAGGSTSFVIPVTPTAAAAASVTNSATVSGGGDATCPAAARCTSSVTTPVTAPQLTMTKTGPASFTVGVASSYTLGVQNTGTAATTAVATVTDTIPAGLTIGTLPAGCSASGQTVTCTIAAGLGAGSSTSFVIPVTAASANAGGTSVTNTASVSGGGDPTCPGAARCSSTVVTPVAANIDAVDDFAPPQSFPAGTGGTTPSVVGNDTTNGVAVALGAGGNATLTPGASPAAGITMNPDGTIAVAANVAPGTYVYPYTLCTNPPTTPATCDTANATVTVTASIDAIDDSGSVANGAAGGTAVPNVLQNDVSNGQPATLANVTLTQVATTNPNVTLNPATGAVNVAAGTPAGTYTVTYQICTNPATTPATCDTATVTVTVGAAVIDAVNDDYSGTPVNGAVGGTTPSVLGNDTLGGSPATVGAGGNVTLTPGAAPTPAAGSITMNPDGTITVAPGTTAGTYTYPYTICEVLNPNNCDTATATVVVAAAVIDAVNDTGTVPNGAAGGTAVPNVLVNDTLNGAPATLATVILTQVATTNPNVTLDPATGAVNVAPGTPAGTYVVTYQICEILNPTNCDTATVTVTVAAAVIDAVNDDYSGTPVNGAVGGTTPSVLGNDTLGGSPATVGAGGNVTLTPGAAPTPAAGSITMNPDGTITVAPGTTAGTYTYPYTICEVLNPNNCDTATATIVVAAAVIDAVNDTGTVPNGAAGGTAVPNVLVNDTLNGAPATLATVILTQVATTNPNVTLDPATGAVNVAPGTPAGTYVVTYQICEQLNPTNCDTATVTVTVAAAVIDAVNDDYSGTPVNGAAGGTTPSVLGNDTLGGSPATVGAGGNVTLTPGAAPTPAAGSITMNPDGTITVAPGTTAGTYTYPYTICEVLNPTNCDTATATIVVAAAVIDAVNDTGTVPNGSAGGVAVPNVLVNDTLNGQPATLATVTLTQVATTNPNVTLDPATGAVNVAPGTPAGTYTVTYQICEILNPTNCDAATVTVTVAAAVIDAVNDDYSGTPVNGAVGGTTASVLGNDTLGGNPVTVGAGGNVTLTPGAAPAPAAGSITMNPDGTITVAPGTTAGTYAYAYTICEVLNPNNCDTATATVVVAAAPIDAINDTGTVPNGAAGGTAVPNVLVNDTLNGAPATLATVILTQVATTNPNVTLDPATGAVNVAPGTPAGTYVVTYQICEQLNPTNCDTATVTVTVGAAPIDAVDDTGSVASGATGGTAVPNVLVNDTLNGQPATLATVTLTQVSTSNPNVTLDPATGAVNVAPGTPAGTYTVTYQICEILNPTNCDTATVTVTVGAAPIDAVDDTGSVASGATGGTAVPSVLVNDTLNGQPATLATVTLTQVSTSNPNVTLDPATGAVNVAPGTPAGTYTVTYQICEILNPTNCDTATVTVTVGAASIVANDDTATTPQNTPVTISVLGNDTLGGAAVTPAQVTVTQVNPPANGSIVINPDGTIIYTPNSGFSGNDTFTYQVCEVLNPTNCATATVTVTVQPNAVQANDDTVTTTQNTPVTSNVLGNDTSGGAPLNPASVSIVAQSPNGTAVANPDGTITFTPAPGFSGTATYTYQVCDTSTPTPVCDQAVVSVTIPGNVVTATDDTVTADPEVPVVITVVGNDTTTGAALDPNSLVVVTPPANGTVVCQAGACTYTSNPGFTGTDTFTYRVCDTSAPTPVCDIATVTVDVQGETAVRLTKQATPRDVRAGDLVRYTVTMENTGDAAVVDGALLDTPPAGFTFVDGSLDVADRDGAARLVGTYPIRVDQIDIAIGGRATVTYLLRVGAGVRGGLHVNSAQLQDGGQSVSNVGTASVQLVADPTVDDSLILGTVFDDRDGDGWQDSAKITGLRVQGGFAPGAYVAGSTTVDRGNGPQPQADASAPLLHGIALGEIGGRQSEAEPAAARRVVVSQVLTAPEFTGDFVLTTAEGVTVRMDAAGNATVERGQGEAARGLSAAAPTVQRTVSQVQGGYRVDYVIANDGVDERGIPGVRIASVEGLLMETDQYGRYHVVGIDGGRFERGRNFILKVDPATLPPGTTFTTDNPLVRRITPGLPVRFDFGVKLPPGLVQAAPQAVELELGTVLLAPDSAQIAARHAPVIDAMAEQVRKHGAGEVVIAANGESQALAYDRAAAVRDALLQKLSPEEAAALTVSLRTDAADPGSLLVSLGATASGNGPVLGTVLFDTDKAEIRPQYAAILEQVADDIEALAASTPGDLIVGVVGKADARGGDAYNVQLGLRRAKAVYDALAARLAPEVRARVRVETSEDPTAPVGLQRR